MQPRGRRGRVPTHSVSIGPPRTPPVLRTEQRRDASRQPGPLICDRARPASLHVTPIGAGQFLHDASNSGHHARHTGIVDLVWNVVMARRSKSRDAILPTKPMKLAVSGYIRPKGKGYR